MKILIVDDSRHIRTQLKVLLNSDGYSDLVFAKTACEAFTYLGIDSPKPANDQQVALILMDIIMPDMDGIVACRKIKAVDHLQDIPVIMVTGDTTPESLQQAFDAGAVDYITKPLKKVELLARVGSVLRLKHEIDVRKSHEKELLDLTRLLEETNTKLQQSNEMLQRTASVDGLTGIANRRYFDEFVEKEWRRAIRLSRPISLIMTDIDFFKAYNDTYGHLRGDDCLKQVAKALDDALKRPLDFVARYGGEEFVVLLPDTDSDGAAEVAKLMQENIANMKITHSGSEAYDHLTISLGIATITPSRESTPDVLIDLADKALYQAKTEGRNRFKIFSDPK